MANDPDACTSVGPAHERVATSSFDSDLEMNMKSIPPMQDGNTALIMVPTTVLMLLYHELTEV